MNAYYIELNKLIILYFDRIKEIKNFYIDEEIREKIGQEFDEDCRELERKYE